MIEKVRCVELNYVKYPYEVKLFDEGDRLLRTFKFNKLEEATKAVNEMNYEILKYHNKV